MSAAARGRRAARTTRQPRSQYSSSIHISRALWRGWLLALSQAVDAAGEGVALSAASAASSRPRESRWQSQLYAIVRTMPGFFRPAVMTASSGRSSFMRMRLVSVMTCARRGDQTNARPPAAHAAVRRRAHRSLLTDKDGRKARRAPRNGKGSAWGARLGGNDGPAVQGLVHAPVAALRNFPHSAAARSARRVARLLARSARRAQAQARGAGGPRVAAAAS